MGSLPALGVGSLPNAINEGRDATAYSRSTEVLDPGKLMSKADFRQALVSNH